MTSKLSIDTIWLLLMALTLITAGIAESAEPGLLVTLAVAMSVAFKGRMIVDRFMELAEANHYIRNAMRIYFYVIPAMIILVYLFPQVLMQATTIS